MPATRSKKEQRRKKNFRICRCKPTCHKLLARATRQKHYRKLMPDEKKHRARSLSSGSESPSCQLVAPSIKSDKSIDQSVQHFDVSETERTELADEARCSESSESGDIFPEQGGIDNLGSEQDSNSNLNLESEQGELVGGEDLRGEQGNTVESEDAGELGSERHNSSEPEDAGELGSEQGNSSGPEGAEELGSERGNGSETADAGDNWGVEQDDISEIKDGEEWVSVSTNGKHVEEDRQAGSGGVATREDTNPESDVEGEGSDIEGEESESEKGASPLSDDEDKWAKYDESEEHMDTVTHQEKLKQIDDILLLEHSIEEWKHRMKSV